MLQLPLLCLVRGITFRAAFAAELCETLTQLLRAAGSSDTAHSSCTNKDTTHSLFIQSALAVSIHTNHEPCNGFSDCLSG